MDLLTRQQLLATGQSGDEIDRMAANGTLVRVRRGLYARATVQPSSPEEEHLRRVRAVVAATRSDHVVSHVSAAVVRALPVPTDALGRVHLTRERVGGGKRRGDVCIHTSPLPTNDVGTCSSLPVTTPARTFVDVARRLPTGWAVALGDQVRRQGTSSSEVEQVLGRMSGWPGVGRARRAAVLLDPRSESVGESLSRVLLVEAGLTPMDLQLPVVGADGDLVGRVDFAWPEHRTIGEFDGRVKYGRSSQDGPAERDKRGWEDVVWAEKVREDLLRDLGWFVVRWTWDDLWRPGLVATRVRRAFERDLRSRTR